MLGIRLVILCVFRGDVEREREREERRVAEISQNLERYKREVGNCQTASREMRDEEARLESKQREAMQREREAQDNEKMVR